MKILNFVISGTFLVSTTLSPMWAYADAVKVVKEAETASQPKGTPAPKSTGIPSTPTAGVNDNANNAQAANNGGSGASSMMGTALTTAGSLMIAQGSSSPTNPPLIAAGVVLVGMGMLSFKQSKADKKAANAAGVTGNLSDAYDDTYSNNGGLVDTSQQAIAEDKAVRALEQAGIYNPKTGKITAGGKAYKASDFSSPSAMAAAGIPQGAISGAMAYADKEGKKIAESEKVKLGALTAANGYQEGSSSGGGGGAGAYPGTPTEAYGAGAGAGGAGGTGATREPTNLAGMQKNYNGEPIGVSADSIFNMMARRYKVKDSQESFYSDTDLALKK